MLTKSAHTEKEFSDYTDDLCNHELSNKSNQVNCVFTNFLIIKGSMPFARLHKTKETGFTPFYLKLRFIINDIKGISTNMEGIYQLNFLASLDLHLIYRKLHIFSGSSYYLW